jgi:hypothetical protein
MKSATIWPRQLPAAIRSESRRAAEIKVYDALSEQLPLGWAVYYSRPWHGETSTGAEIDGECDFIVAHASHGVLFIEVKGGSISYDPELDQWHSVDRYKIKHRIKNPLKQAVDSKYHLLAKAKAQRGWPKGHIRFRHAVIFPDVGTVPAHLGADKPRELIATRSDMQKLGEWIVQRLSGGDEDPLGRHGLNVIDDLVAHPIQLRVPFGHIAADDDEAIDNLTPQQFHILTAIQDLNRVAISGGAGTGKTVLACEDARRHSEQGVRTLLTCGSGVLAEHLRVKLEGTHVEVATFSNVCRKIAVQAGLITSEGDASKSDLPELLFYALAKCPELAYDVVIVDEAQDFPSVTWDSIAALVSSADTSSLHVYFDSNQKIYGDLRGHFDSYTLLPIRLSRNLRNTQNVHDAAQLFYRGPHLTADGPEGAQVRWIEAEDSIAQERLVDEVRTLVYIDEVSPADITVLTVNKDSLLAVETSLRDFVRKGLSIFTISDFKGLENRFVILVASRVLSDAPELAYVALSRARVHLSVLGSVEILHWLRMEGID